MHLLMEARKCLFSFSRAAHQRRAVLIGYSTYSKAVCTEEFGETINSNATLEKSFQVTPLLSNNKEKRGLSVDGRLKHEDTHLASTTMSQGDKEMQGIIISYKLKVNLVMSGGDVELPLTLMSPKPAERISHWRPKKFETIRKIIRGHRVYLCVM